MRKEQDSIGELSIPSDAYYGIQSYRASQNFPISGTQIHPELIKSYLKLKKAAAIANNRAKALDKKRTDAIIRAVEALLSEDYLKHFIVDTYQAGAGTSQNMNANEAIANKANKLLGKKLGSYNPVHPNDHVNMSQSTNDTYPTAMRLSTLALSQDLLKELQLLAKSLGRKSEEFDGVLKAGRTHLQDAVPIRLGQEFGAYREAVAAGTKLVRHAQGFLRELGIGGSAAGTGMNVPKGYRAAILKELKKLFEEPRLTLSENMCFAMQSQLPLMVYSNSLRAIALELTRIVNDLRLMSSGPLNGLGEIRLPDTQPGSSIMPGKVNPSILEMANQVLFKILGNDAAMAYAQQAGQLELNVMMPLMASLALESTQVMTSTLKTLRLRCIDGITANAERCQQYVERTPQIAAALNPVIGYKKAGEIAKEAVKRGVTVLDIVRERKLLTEQQIKKLLDPRKPTQC